MHEQKPHQGRELRVVATAANEAEADLLEQRLAEAGIDAISQRTIGGPEFGASGAHYLYVEATQLDRAREVLSAGAVSEEELTRLSEQSSADDAGKEREG
jgi:hypothetical protein